MSLTRYNKPCDSGKVKLYAILWHLGVSDTALHIGITSCHINHPATFLVTQIAKHFNPVMQKVHYDLTSFLASSEMYSYEGPVLAIE